MKGFINKTLHCTQSLADTPGHLRFSETATDPEKQMKGTSMSSRIVSTPERCRTGASAKILTGILLTRSPGREARLELSVSLAERIDEPHTIMHVKNVYPAAVLSYNNNSSFFLFFGPFIIVIHTYIYIYTLILS